MVVILKVKNNIKTKSIIRNKINGYIIYCYMALPLIGKIKSVQIYL